MEGNQVSRTALSSAFTRGYHAEHGSPKVFDDFLAHRFLTEEESTHFTQFMLTAIQTLNPAAAAAFPDTAATLEWMMQSSGAMPLILGRSKYTEECLEEAVVHGVSQYVILGAGRGSPAGRFKPDGYPEALFLRTHRSLPFMRTCPLCQPRGGINRLKS